MKIITGGNVKLKESKIRLLANKMAGNQWVLIKRFNSNTGLTAEAIKEGERTSGDISFAGTANGMAVIDIDLDCLNTNVEKISLVVFNLKNNPISNNVSILVSDKEPDEHQIEDSLLNRNESCLIIAEIYKHNSDFKIKNLGSGFTDVNRAMQEYFGIKAWNLNSMVNSSLMPQVFVSREPHTESNLSITNNFGEPFGFPFREESTFGDKIMSFIDGLKKAVSAGRSELATQVLRFKNKTFMEGAVAICTYVAMSSKGVGSEEKQKMLEFIKRSDELKVFNTNEVIAFYNKLVENYEFDFEVGKGEAMKVIMRLLDKREEAQLAIRVGIAVAKSDGEFDSDEKTSVVAICNNLRFNASDFGL